MTAQEEHLEEPETDTGEFSVSPRQLAYVTLLLASVSLFNALDRQGLSILIEPIKADLDLSDTQLGILTGFAFSLTYAVFGIPLARLADTRNRVKLLALCLAVWSLATAIAGLASNFIQLALARVFVGIGEAGGTPSSLSIMGDYYKPEVRSRGMGLFYMGGAVGGTVGLGVIGFIADQYGWRVAMFSMGLPGVVLAVVLLTTLREPIRGRFQESPAFNTDINWIHAIREVLGRKSMRHLLIAFGVASFGGSGAAAWFGAFFMRVHQLSLTEVGALMAVSIGASSLLGTFLGAMLGPKLVRRDRRWEVWWPGTTYLIVLPTYILAFSLDDLNLVIGLLVFASLVGSTNLGLMMSGLQSVLPAHVRGMGVALVMFVANFIGAGAGPLLVGVLSDALTPSYGVDGLRYAMMISVSLMFWGVIHFFIAGKHFLNDVVD